LASVLNVGFFVFFGFDFIIGFKTETETEKPLFFVFFGFDFIIGFKTETETETEKPLFFGV
jgi:hypothetical protein